MDTQHTEQTQRLEHDMRHLGNRFDRHLEIYAANGKELAAVKQNVASLDKTITEFYRSFNTYELAQKEVLNQFVQKGDFATVKNIVYGAITIIVVSFMGALIALVIK